MAGKLAKRMTGASCFFFGIGKNNETLFVLRIV